MTATPRMNIVVLETKATDNTATLLLVVHCDTFLRIMQGFWEI